METLTSIIRAIPYSWLIYSSGTDRPGKLCYSFSRMTLLRWLTFLIGSLTVTLTVLLFCIYFSSDASICSKMSFLPLENSDHAVVSVSIDFQSNSKRDGKFHHIAHDSFRANWDGLRGHLRDVPWEDIFKFGASAATSEFCEWVQVRIDVYIPHRKYHVKPQTSSLFIEKQKLKELFKSSKSLSNVKAGSH